MGREIRRVPANWEHPKELIESRDGVEEIYIGMPQGDPNESLAHAKGELERYIVAFEYWRLGKVVHFDIETGLINGQETIAEYCDRRLLNMRAGKYAYSNPRVEREYEERRIRFNDICYPPECEDIGNIMPYGDWYQLFENVGDGTPLSPPFEKPEELIEWLVNNDDFWGNRWSREAAENILRGGYAPSMVIANGVVYLPHNMPDLT